MTTDTLPHFDKIERNRGRSLGEPMPGGLEAMAERPLREAV
jgi:hypothetical protein